MASTASDLLKFEKQATGENASTWGTKANVSMSRIEEAIAGYRAITVAGATYTLDDTQYTENSTTTSESHLSVIKCTGTPGAARLIAVPARTKHYTVWNAVTTFDVTFGISGNTVVTVPTGYIVNVFCDGTNTYATSPMVDTSGGINMNGNGIFDANGLQLLSFTETASAVNELTIKNEVAGTNPGISATGGDTNIGIDLIPKGSGVVQQNGTAVGLTGAQTIWIPVAAMQPTTSNGCAALVNVETTAGRPDMQVMDFDSTADEHAQFSVMFPKSWNLLTVTFRAVWTTTATDTDGVSWGLQGVACGDGDTIDVAYGTGVVVDDAGQSTAEDMYLTAESTAVTIAGTPADDQICYFRVYRDIDDSNDTATEDARLMGVKIIFITDLGNDT